MKRISVLIAATFMLPVFAASCANSAEPGKAPDASASAPADADKEWGMPNKNYASTRYSTLNGINTDTVKIAEGCMDVLHRRSARTRRRPARGRKHHVRPHSLSRHRLCPRPH